MSTDYQSNITNVNREELRIEFSEDYTSKIKKFELYRSLFTPSNLEVIGDFVLDKEQQIILDRLHFIHEIIMGRSYSMSKSFVLCFQTIGLNLGLDQDTIISWLIEIEESNYITITHNYGRDNYAIIKVLDNEFGQLVNELSNYSFKKYLIQPEINNTRKIVQLYEKMLCDKDFEKLKGEANLRLLRDFLAVDSNIEIITRLQLIYLITKTKSLFTGYGVRVQFKLWGECLKISESQLVDYIRELLNLGYFSGILKENNKFCTLHLNRQSSNPINILIQQYA